MCDAPRRGAARDAAAVVGVIIARAFGESACVCVSPCIATVVAWAWACAAVDAHDRARVLGVKHGPCGRHRHGWRGVDVYSVCVCDISLCVCIQCIQCIHCVCVCVCGKHACVSSRGR